MKEVKLTLEIDNITELELIATGLQLVQDDIEKYLNSNNYKSKEVINKMTDQSIKAERMLFNIKKYLND